MFYRITFSALTIFLLAGNAFAQDDNLSLNLNYNYSIPISNFKSDLVQESSPRGFTGNLMYKLNPAVSLGLGVGYQDYYQRYPRKVYSSGESQHISAVMTNSIQLVPVMARVEFSPFSNTTTVVHPYVSVAAGANFINYSQYLGQFASTVTNTGFRAQGGLGVKIPLTSSGWGIDIGGSYDYAPFKKYNLKDLSSLNVRAGVYFGL